MPYLPVADPSRSASACAHRMHPGRMLLLLLALSAAGCASGPPPTLYLLEPSSPTTASPTAIAGVKAIGVSTVRLPDYASDPQVVTQAGDRSLARDDRQRWAESPDRAITRVLADGLRVRAEAGISVEPWPRGFDPDRRIDLVFDRLVRTAAGGVSMRGQIQISSGDGREIVALEPFVVEQPANGSRTIDFFDATAAGIDRLAQIVFEILAAEPS